MSEEAPAPAPAGGERIAKRIARAGICSRREAERLIAQGRVAVDGKVLDDPAFNVRAEQRVTLDGREIPAPERPRLWRYHKPRGLVTTHRDPEGRPTVFAHLPPALRRAHAVGRLDINSEGLLLLTNDGALKRRLEHPSTGWIRRYRVRIFGRPDPAALARLRQGIRVAGIAYGPIEARIDRAEGANAWLSVALREGRNREVRRVLGHLGLGVSRLIRTSFGPFHLGSLPRGEVREVPARVLAEQLGLPTRKAGRGHGAHRRRPA